MTIRGIRNNNPFNIRISNSSWIGKISHSSDPCFEQFTSMDFGIRAGFALLRTYIQKYKLCTVSQIISRFAPSSENPTKRYIDFVCSNSGLLPSSTIGVFDYNFFKLCRGILLFESQFALTYSKYLYILKNYFDYEEKSNCTGSRSD